MFCLLRTSINFNHQFVLSSLIISLLDISQGVSAYQFTKYSGTAQTLVIRFLLVVSLFHPSICTQWPWKPIFWYITSHIFIWENFEWSTWNLSLFLTSAVQLKFHSGVLYSLHHRFKFSTLNLKTYNHHMLHFSFKASFEQTTWNLSSLSACDLAHTSTFRIFFTSSWF